MKKLVTILFVLFIFAVGLFSETWIYKREVIIIPVGDKENEIKINYNKYEMGAGPTSFVLDEDENIYIRIGIKNIIKKFDKNGKYICSSKSERGCGDVVRFLGYNKGIIYTMSGDANNPAIRRYDKDLNYIDCHKIKKDFKRQWIGLSFITNYKGDIGFLSNTNPKKIKFRRIELQDNYWRMINDKLFDFSYPKVDLTPYCRALGFHFINYDANDNLYFLALTGYKIKNKIYIVTRDGKVIETNILLDRVSYHGIAFSNSVTIFVSRKGDIYNLIPLLDGVRFVKWHKIREEK